MFSSLCLLPPSSPYIYFWITLWTQVWKHLCKIHTISTYCISCSDLYLHSFILSYVWHMALVDVLCFVNSLKSIKRPQQHPEWFVPIYFLTSYMLDLFFIPSIPLISYPSPSCSSDSSWPTFFNHSITVHLSQYNLCFCSWQIMQSLHILVAYHLSADQLKLNSALPQFTTAGQRTPIRKIHFHNTPLS